VDPMDPLPQFPELFTVSCVHCDQYNVLPSVPSLFL
jgi:hypothetical protein